MRVQVDPDRCQGHTLCAMIAPESFALDDVDGHAQAVDGDVADPQTVAEAVHSCPEQAISVVVDHIRAARAARGVRQES